MQKLAVVSLALLLSSCGWTGRQWTSFANWSDRNMPTYSDYSGGDEQQPRQVPPQYQQQMAPQPYPENYSQPYGHPPQPYGQPQIPEPPVSSLPPLPGQQSYGQSLPHSFSNTNVPYRAVLPQQGEDDFPEEYRHIEGGSGVDVAPTQYIQRPGFTNEQYVPTVPNMPPPMTR